MQEIEQFMQQTYTFITSSSRRLGEYVEVVEEFAQPTAKPTQLYKNRWIASEHDTVKTFFKNWLSYLITATRITSDSENYARSIREEATSLSQKLKNKDILITIVLLQDFTIAFLDWSKATQLYGSLMIDQAKYFEKLQTALDDIENLESPSLKSFLTSCECSETVDTNKIGCEVDEYENSDSITWRNRDFLSNDKDWPKISYVAKKMVDLTRKILPDYIDAELIENLAIFSPARMPASYEALMMEFGTEDSNNNFGVQEVTYFAWKIGLDLSTLLKDWSELVKKMTLSPNWRYIRSTADTNSFWTRVSNDPYLFITWKDSTLTLIRVAKSFAAGSAVCESGFSHLNTLKNKLRSQLSDDNLNNLLFVIINGPTNQDFDEYRYAEKYYTAGHRLPSASTESQACPREFEERESEQELEENQDENNNEPNSNNVDEENFEESKKYRGNRLRTKLM